MLKINFFGDSDMFLPPRERLIQEADPKWFEDEFVKQMILDIDQTECYGMYNMKSRVLGPINVSMLSAGVSNLILAYKTDLVIDATKSGDNCAKWYQEIAKNKDVTLNLAYSMHFTPPFEIYCINTGTIMTTWKEFMWTFIPCYEEAIAENAKLKEDWDEI